MQADPSKRSNATKVIDCLEWLLKQIAPANSANGRVYITDGVVVDRKRDPRKITQDLATDLRSTGTLVKIREGDGKTLTGKAGYVGNSKRTTAGLELICWSVMSDPQDRAGITADQMQSWLRDDIDQALSNDDNGTDCITRASNTLATIAGPWGGPGLWGSRPSCIDLTIDGWTHVPLNNFPNFIQILKLSYLFDKIGPGRRPGVL